MGGRKIRGERKSEYLEDAPLGASSYIDFKDACKGRVMRGAYGEMAAFTCSPRNTAILITPRSAIRISGFGLRAILMPATANPAADGGSAVAKSLRGDVSGPTEAVLVSLHGDPVAICQLDGRKLKPTRVFIL